jgi:hypothetical protein
MENINRFEKWYSNYVIKHYKEPLSAKIENTSDFGWKILITGNFNSQMPSKELKESDKRSNFNFYGIDAKHNKFEAQGDFTKLDFLFGKFMSFVGEIETISFEGDQFLREHIQKFIFEHERDSFIFLHYTPEKSSAESIMKSGFRFNVAFDKTTVGIQNDPTVVNYNHILRKPFGKYVVVICISKNIYLKYNDLITKSSDKYSKVEEVLTEIPPVEDEFSEKTHTLHHKFIKGYIDYTNGQVVMNPEYDNNYDSEIFIKNIPTEN